MTPGFWFPVLTIATRQAGNGLIRFKWSKSPCSVLHLCTISNSTAYVYSFSLMRMSLIHVQLAVQFLQGSSAPQSCWTMVGIGIRLAQDVGAHRRKVHQRALTVEDELWKRAFWYTIQILRGHTLICAQGPRLYGSHR